MNYLLIGRVTCFIYQDEFSMVSVLIVGNLGLLYSHALARRVHAFIPRDL